MTSTTFTPTASVVTFSRVLRAERIKIRSIRSTLWAAILAVVFSAGFTGLIVFGVAVASTEGKSAIDKATTETFGPTPTLGALVFAFAIAQVMVAILGVLIVTPERASGLMAATVAAVPRRKPILLAKIVTSAAVSAIIGLATGLVSFVIAEPAFAANGYSQSLVDVQSIQVILGGALYLAMVGALATAIGILFRSTALAAGIVVGLLLVVPTVLQLIPVVGNLLAAAMPTALGTRLYTPADGWTTLIIGAGGLVIWVSVATVVGSMYFSKRDV